MPQQVPITIVGMATIPDPTPQPPLGIWGPTDPRPTQPIYLPPTQLPIQPPLGIWGPPGPWPTPPIYLPPTQLPIQPPPVNAGGGEWMYSQTKGWVYVYDPASGGKPQPVP